MKRTLVTAIYYTAPTSRMGGRGYTFEFYEAPFRNILNLGCNIIVYSYGNEIEKIKSFFITHNFIDFKIIEYDLNSHPYSNVIYDIKEKTGIINEKGLLLGKSAMENDRCHHLCLSKMFFIKDSIINNYFNSEKHYWIDAGLFHHGIIPETYGGIEKFTKINEKNYWPILEKSVCKPNLIEKLENKNNTGYIFIGSTQHTNSPWIIGGLFGGNNDVSLELYKDFTELSSSMLNDGILTLEERVLTDLFKTKYEKYNCIKFQSWYHDIPGIPNYFGINRSTESFYKIFI